MTGVRRLLDRTAAVLLVLAFGWFTVSAAFHNRETDQTVAYTLPAANLVARGELTMPQLGSQLGLDRLWRLNAPWMALEPVPWMAVLGPGRVPSLVGLVFLAWVSGLAVWVALRRQLPGAPVSLVAAAGLAFLLQRSGVIAELYNQRPTVAAPLLLLLAFWPGGQRAWWQWLVAGSLPLVHPSLAPVSAVWLVVAVARWRLDTTESRPARWAGPVAFALGVVAAAVWYGHPEGLRDQFLPHLAFGNYRFRGYMAGTFLIPASPPAAAPTVAVNILILGAALGIAGAALRRRWSPALPPALALLAVLPFDVIRGFLYLPWYYVGLGPCLLQGLPEGRPRRVGAGVLAAVGLAGLVVSAKLDRSPPDLTTTAQGRAFVLDQTRAGDRVVLGPPFVLVAAPAALPDGRTAPRVVPNDYYLRPFSREVFARDIEAACDVYVGEEEWFYRPVWVEMERGAPLFPRADMIRAEFRGRPVIVARKRSD